MKLSYRDKVIFICAIVIVILVAGFFLFIKPKYQEMTSAKSKLESKETEKVEVQAKIDTLTPLVDQLKATAEEVKEMQERFLPEQDPYLNEQFIYDILNQNGVEVRSLTTTYTTADELEDYVVYPSNVVAYDLLMQGDLYSELPEEVYNLYNDVDYPDPENITIGITDVVVTYLDDFDLTNVYKFIDAVAEDDRTFHVLDILQVADEGDVEYESTMTVRIYSIYPLNIEKIMEETDEVEIVAVPAEGTEEAAAE